MSFEMAIYLNKPSKFLIYGCIDPRTLLIRYIGRSSSGCPILEAIHALPC